MATVEIGGKTLRVLTVDEPGSFAVDIERARVGAELSAATTNVERFKKLAEAIFCYVRCNEGVTLEWLIGVLPANVGPILNACKAAYGAEVASRGEAKTPEARQ